MRVLFWSSTFWPTIGGVQVLAAKLLPALEERGYEHIVVTSQSRKDQFKVTHYNGIPMHRFRFWNSMVNIDQFVQIRQQVGDLKRTFAPHLIHVNAVSRNDFFHHLTAHVHPVPVVVTLHGAWLPEANMIVKRTLQNATWVVGCSEATLELGRRLVPEIGDRSSVIHNAVKEPAILPKPLPADVPPLLCLGRLIARKGFDLVLRALALLIKSFPNLRLTIAGDGPERTTLQQLAGKLGVAEAVDFIGSVAPDKVPALMNSATIVVVPSRQEPFGLVALEAAWMARSVVAMHVGGLSEVVVPGQTGLLVESGNLRALIEAIAFLLERPTTAKGMGQTGRRRALEYFSWDQYVDAYDALYQRLVNPAKAKTVSLTAMSQHLS